jgi:hypothetical protein
LTFSPTFWTFTVDSFSGYENISITMNINILLWQIGDSSVITGNHNVLPLY